MKNTDFDFHIQLVEKYIKARTLYKKYYSKAIYNIKEARRYKGSAINLYNMCIADAKENRKLAKAILKKKKSYKKIIENSLKTEVINRCIL